MRTITQTLGGETRIGVIDVAVLVNLFDQIPDIAFFVKDTGGRYIAVNHSLVSRHGMPGKSEVLGRRPRDICPGEFGDLPSQQDTHILTTGESLLDHLEMQWDTPHQPVWCLTTKLPLRDAAGEIVGLIGISQDLRTPVNSSAIPLKVAEALNYLEKNLADAITPSALAKRSGMLPQRLARLMKRFFGLTPSQYILKLRITAAAQMLRESEASVGDVAVACGFFDHSAFTRAFRKVTGLTPTQLRHG